MEVIEGQIYKHFKNILVKVLHIAFDSETLKKKVVYIELSNGKIWIRDYDMFCSKVDKKKYPDVEQIYRFEHYD